MGSLNNSTTTEPIAIIGLACRFAGDATDPQKLWSLLAEGRSAWTKIPSSRFNHHGAYHSNPDKLSGTSVKGGHFLKEDVGLFDASFFGFSAETAATLDPQIRLQLESVYEAFENAGLTLGQIAGSNTSVFAGIFSHDYREMMVKDPDTIPRFFNTGVSPAMVANRISHFFDLRGNSVSVDTGCSTSGVGLQLACQSLRTGESDMALVGGSNLLLSPDQFKAMSSLGLLSPDGKSYTFDSKANGYGRGDGVATVVLKRLSDALEAGDPIRAVIREVMTNQDGKTDTITTPSQHAQQTLAQACYDRAGLDPVDTQYCEAHGTGTQTGDKIEAKAICNVFDPPGSRHRENPLFVGSVKTNIGHTEPTSGLASVIKTVLAMEKGWIPPSINFQQLNPKLGLSDNVQVVRSLTPWQPTADGVRRASVSNFGYGGTNTHVILEGADQWRSIYEGKSLTVEHPSTKTPATTPKLFLLSAKDEISCKQMAANLREYLISQPASSPAKETSFMESLCHTLNNHRTQFPWVAAYSARTKQELIQALDPNNNKSRPVRRNNTDQLRIGFVFTGQGANWHAMGRELLSTYPVYKASILEADAYLKEFGSDDWSLLEELQQDAESSRVNQLDIAMPTSVAVQVSLVRLLRSWGVTPTAVTSHSSGEIAAAYAAGALSYRSALAVAWARSRATAEGLESSSNPGNKFVHKGGMIAVGLDPETTNRYISRLKTGRASPACFNSPSSVTVSGDLTAVDELESVLKKEGIFARKLKVDAAYHSHHMGPLVEPYLEILDKVYKVTDEDHTLDPGISYSSPCTGTRMTEGNEIADPMHWANSLVKPVLFVDAFRDMVLGNDATPNVEIIIEVGPHGALGGPIREILQMPEFQGLDIPYLTCLMRKSSAVETMQSVASGLLIRGYPVDLDSVNHPHGKPSTPLSILTDLPPYPWNHTTRHWYEPRYNRTVRERKHAPHPLLGTLVPGYNPEFPAWRNILRTSEIPWLREHTIQSDHVFPGAGYICLAIEAIRQFSNDRGSLDSISGYALRQVEFLRGLVIPDTTEGIEIQTWLRPVEEKSIGLQGWTNFQVFCITAENIWTEHARGVVKVETSQDSSPLLDQALKNQSYTKRFDPQDLYTSMQALGIVHGPTFQTVKSIRQSSSSHNNKASVSKFSIAETYLPGNDDLPEKHIIHPTTLDSIFQGAYAALPGLRLEMAMVPIKIGKLWISNTIEQQPGHEFQVFSTINKSDRQKFQTNLAVIDTGNNSNMNHIKLSVKVEDLLCQAAGGPSPSTTGTGTTQSNTTGIKNLNPENQLCTSISWAPDYTFLSSTRDSILKLKLKNELSYSSDSFPLNEEIATILSLRRVCLYYIFDAIDSLSLSPSDIDALKNDPQNQHLFKFYTWMKTQARLANENQLAETSSTWYKESLDKSTRQFIIESVAKSSVNGEMVVRLGPHLASLLRPNSNNSSDMDMDIPTPLELMLKDKLLYKYYNKALKWDRSTAQMARIFRHLIHKNPHMKILEIGAGTGGATRVLLNTLSTGSTGNGGGLSGENLKYTFTDISSGYFESAREEFAAWGDILEFKKLDIESSPADQEFNLPDEDGDMEGKYDLVVACQVLHATHDMAKTMSNVRKLLKPGGKLLLIETTRDQLDAQFVFGLLPGWWLGVEPERVSSPSLSVPMWDSVLRGAGFGSGSGSGSGIDLHLRDCEDGGYYSFSMIVASAAHQEEVQTKEVVHSVQEEGPETEVVIVVREACQPPVEWVEEFKGRVRDACERKQLEVRVVKLESVRHEDLEGKTCIFLGEAAAPFLVDMDVSALEAVKHLATTCQSLLWVTRGGAVECTNPDAALAAGLIRTLRLEHAGKRYVLLDLDPSKESAWSTDEAVSISHVLAESILVKSTGPEDMEFAIRDGKVLIPRLYKDVARNETIVKTNIHQRGEPQLEVLYQPGRRLKLTVGSVGLLDTLAFEDDNSDFPENNDDLIEVQPKAYGLNFRDVMVAMGQLEERALGYECSGIVTSVGKNASSQGYSVGDRVFCVHPGGLFANRVSIPWTSASHIPEGVSFEDAASFGIIFTTAAYSLYDVAKLQPGQSVLIHAAAGGVGQAAIMLAQRVQAEIFVTAGTKEKRDFLSREYGIPEDHIFSSRDSAFGSAIRSTGRGGVDVVLNSLSGSLLQESFDCLAPMGHFVEIGKKDLQRNNHLAMRAFSRAASFTAVDLNALNSYKSREFNQLMKRVAGMLADKQISVVRPVTVYSLSDIEKAFRVLQAGKHMGKVVFTVRDDDLVKVYPRTESAKFTKDATYLIVGGAGGIGQSIAQWMASRGAKNLLLLSRNAATNINNNNNTNLVSELKQQYNCQVKAINCDVSDPASLSSALSKCHTEFNLPPIRGVIHGGMVLQDSIFERMSINDWNSAVRPKVQGSWNLHTQLEQHSTKLDFFIMLSSVSGVLGHTSQANYTAGGSFQDALAAYRVSKKLSAVSIDLGVVKSVGYVAQREDVVRRMTHDNYVPISEEQLLSLIESAILSPPENGQIVTGINCGSGGHWDPDSKQLGGDAKFGGLRYLARRGKQDNKSGSSRSGKDGSKESLASKLGNVSTVEEAREFVVQEIRQKLAGIFMIPVEEILISRPPAEYGVDSLVAVELRNMLTLHAGAEVSVFDIMQSRSILQLGEKVVEKSRFVKVQVHNLG